MIEIKNLTKKFGEKTVFYHFDLNIEENKILYLLGESGSGKTTLLNILSGLLDYEGEIKGDISPVSFIFQDSVLIPNLTVEENIKLVCPDVNIDEALKSVDILKYKNYYPKALSGGTARRVAILRAFLFPSKLLLMDEAFTSLDVALKYSMINLIRKMQKENPKTIISVTHDIKEAVDLADRIIVLKKKKIIFDEKNVTKKTEDEVFGLITDSRIK